jgi:hypothetical protein
MHQHPSPAREPVRHLWTIPVSITALLVLAGCGVNDGASLQSSLPSGDPAVKSACPFADHAGGTPCPDARHAALFRAPY